MFKRSLMMTLALLLVCTLGSLAVQAADGDAAPAAIDTTASSVVPADNLADSLQVATSYIVAYYFHGNRRCATCLKLEEYSQEALTAAFDEQLKSGALVWRPVNYDEDENQHFIEDYQLYTKAVILSRVEGDMETGWTNLDKIWELVSDHDKYVTYIQEETQAFMSPKTDD
ncbi:MAG: nitrophenyl compound nitroreductase subunit ArsF family protein [bacterium]